MKRIRDLIRDESGLETLEYAIVAAIIIAVAFLVYGSGWGGGIQNLMQNAAASSSSVTL
jgi:Flp pilus assembly pilin Flp